MFGHLHIEERGRPVRVIDLVGPATIGRTRDNDIVLDSDGVSHCHAMLLAQPGGVDLVDLGSTFGTLVNAVPAEPDEPVRLADGAQISIGRAALRYLAPRTTAPMQPLVLADPAPPELAVPHLNTRFEGFDADTPLEVGRSAGLLIWVGAPIAAGEHQSSRPLRLSSAHLAAPLALRVIVRAASRSWRVIAEQPELVATCWGSAQLARYTLAARRPERTRLAVRVEQGDTHHLLQHLVLGVVALEPGSQLHRRPPLRARAVGELSGGPLPLCRACYAPARNGARFCHNCGARI